MVSLSKTRLAYLGCLPKMLSRPSVKVREQAALAKILGGAVLSNSYLRCLKRVSADNSSVYLRITRKQPCRFNRSISFDIRLLRLWIHSINARVKEDELPNHLERRNCYALYTPSFVLCPRVEHTQKDKKRPKTSKEQQTQNQKHQPEK
jgi:hypothetical protein